MRVAALLLIGCLAAATEAAAQSTSASIRGVVRDPTEAVLPGAEITVTNRDTAEVRRTPSAQDGTFQIVLLPPGRYRVVLALDGVAQAVRTPLSSRRGASQNLRRPIMSLL